MTTSSIELQIMMAGNKILAITACSMFMVVLGAVQYYSEGISSTHATQSFSDRCLLPKHPKHGQWVVDGGGFFLPGHTVTRRTRLRTFCFKGYKLYGKRNMRCKRNGEWSRVAAKCLKKNIKETPSENNKKYSTVYPNIFLPESKSTNISCSKEKPIYIPNLSTNKTNIVQETYSWQVALYKIRQKELICSGSLISHRFIISAAHCVTDFEGNFMPKDLYEVSVGKNYLEYDDIRDQSIAQFSSIENMFTPETYQGEVQNFLSDIVLIVTTKYIIFTPNVQPVYLDFMSELDNNLFNSEKTPHGFVAGWGYTPKNNKPSDEVKKVKVLPINLGACRSYFTHDYHMYLTHDKMCTKYFDKDMAVCRGNNGGGFVIERDGNYYLMGVVSLIAETPTNVGGCYGQEVILLTRLAEYLDFIQQKINLYSYRFEDI